MITKKVRFAGLPIAVESPKGSTRIWRDDAGRETGSVQMQHDYGFIVVGQMGGDDEELDCYLGPNEQAANVHVVHQKLGPDYTKWDEDKVSDGLRFAGRRRRPTARSAPHDGVTLVRRHVDDVAG